jgi:hypothetical protein
MNTEMNIAAEIAVETEGETGASIGWIGDELK